MRYLGLGIEEAHHPWSEKTRSFTSREVLDHLVDKVFPHEKTIIFPTEATITVVVKRQAEEVGKRAPDKLRAHKNLKLKHARLNKRARKQKIKKTLESKYG